MSQSNGPQGENWFERHVLASLEDLKRGQSEMLTTALRLHNSNKEKIEDLVEANQLHADNDTKEFNNLKREIATLKPVRLVVYSMVGMVLAAVFGALLAEVIKKT